LDMSGHKRSNDGQQKIDYMFPAERHFCQCSKAQKSRPEPVIGQG
jgi:hypothetical protein